MDAWMHRRGVERAVGTLRSLACVAVTVLALLVAASQTWGQDLPKPSRPAASVPSIPPPRAISDAATTRDSTLRTARKIRWFPDSTVFAPLLAAPRETGLRGGFIVADRPDLDNGNLSTEENPLRLSDFKGANLEAEVALGLRLPVVILRPETRHAPSISLEFETGLFARFFMESSQKDLINADFRVGAPIALGYRGWEARIEIRHMSSHLGDDFIARFGPALRQVSQDGFEAVIARRFLKDLRVYGGGEWNFNLSSLDLVERGTGLWGIEYDPGWRDSGRHVWPFAAADFRVSSLTDRVAGTGVGGVAFRVGTVGLRLETRGHFGPSPMGQFRRFDENFWGLGLRIEPRGLF